MERIPNGDRLRLALPKGRMQPALFQLLAEAGIHVRASDRGYRPSISLPNVDAKLFAHDCHFIDQANVDHAEGVFQ